MATAPEREAQNPAYRPAHRSTCYYGSASLNHPYNLGAVLSGTLRERPPGSGRWELRAYVGQDPETGKPRQVSRTFRGGKRAARKKLDALVSEVHAGHHIGTTATFGKLLDEWLRNLERLGKARSTMETYRIHVKTHIRPALGALRLDKLTAHRLDTYFASLANDKGLSASTIKLNHAVISGALSQAVDWGWISTNPAKRARLREVEQTDTTALSVDQLRALYFAAADEDTDMATTIALAALTGCRRGELCGLKWSDVDWARQCLKVERAWVPGTGGQHLSTTKTGKARTVFVGTEGVAILRRYFDSKVDLLGGQDPEGWLLSLDGGATPLRAKSVSDYMTGLSRRLKIPAHFHTLRHFSATELVHAGVDLPTAAGQMGHSIGVMSEVYLHSSDERGAAAGELIAGIVGKALEAPTTP
jgi:integrase